MLYVDVAVVVCCLFVVAVACRVMRVVGWLMCVVCCVLLCADAVV